MDLFFEKKEFFHIKEMEKLAPKLKGISEYAAMQCTLSCLITSIHETEIFRTIITSTTLYDNPCQ